ncbi:lipopolysaccharide biosynthesis protein [uncultured Parabacteroides sp.]|uniref:lipopolysaccharide biosynthesis protein n=1 Tax=uncultured Parabacteroides sp. TaxID=512312 RepID=UPI002610345C|nr:lipopolysaccharide biosynthesis protein [uncultured Parabacteroides sp.]
MAEQTLKEKTAKGLFWGGLSNGGQQVLNLLFGVILARILSSEDYGLVAMLAIFTGIAGSVLDVGFSTALINQKEIRHDDYNAVFWAVAIGDLIVSTMLFLSAPLIADFYGKPELKILAQIVFLGFWISAMGVVPYALLMKKMMMKEKAIAELSALLLSGIIGIALALNGFAYKGLAIQTVVYVLVGTCLKFYFVGWKPTLPIDFRPLRKMFKFGSKLFLTNIVMQVNNNVFSVVLGKFYTEKETGYYAQGQKWVGMGSLLISGMISGVAQPVFVQVKEQPERLVLVFRKMVRFGAFVSFPLMLGLAFVSEEFIGLLLGEKWLPSVPFMQLFCIWGAISFLWVLYTSLLMIFERSDTYLYGMTFIGLLQLLVVWIMYPLGIYAMVIGYIGMYYLGLFFWHYFVQKLIPVRFLDIIKDLLPYLLIVSVAFLFSYFVVSYVEGMVLRLFLKIGIVAIIYIFILWKMNSVIFRESLEFVKGHLLGKTGR